MIVVSLITLAGIPNAFAALNYLDKLPASFDKVLDTRPEALCKSETLAGAICLPPEHVLADHNRLANYSALFWLLGTAGLTGSEHVVVIGDSAKRRSFLSGLLYVAGQQRISVIDTPVSALALNETGSGTGRSTTRQVVYTQTPRSDKLILKSELQQLLVSRQSLVILDGRSESEYWGRSIRAARGGHIPGALLHRAGDPIETTPDATMIVYANNSTDGYAYLSRLVESNPQAVLYAEGWREWASDGTLPIDAATYADRLPSVKPLSGTSNDSAAVSFRLDKSVLGFLSLSALVLIAFLSFCMYMLGRNRMRSA